MSYMNNVGVRGYLKPISVNGEEERGHISNGGAVHVVNASIILAGNSVKEGIDALSGNCCKK